jgi:uncharacterized lipoprotein YehR (DUF1307 family)
MKKLLSLVVLALVLGMFVVGCSDSGNGSGSDGGRNGKRNANTASYTT